MNGFAHPTASSLRHLPRRYGVSGRSNRATSAPSSSPRSQAGPDAVRCRRSTSDQGRGRWRWRSPGGPGQRPVAKPVVGRGGYEVGWSRRAGRWPSWRGRRRWPSSTSGAGLLGWCRGTAARSRQRGTGGCGRRGDPRSPRRRRERGRRAGYWRWSRRRGPQHLDRALLAGLQPSNATDNWLHARPRQPCCNPGNTPSGIHARHGSSRRLHTAFPTGGGDYSYPEVLTGLWSMASGSPRTDEGGEKPR